MPFSGLVFVPFLLIEKEPKRSSEKISSNRIFSQARAVNPEGACHLGQSLHQWKPQASFPTRFAVRGAAPDGGPSIGWRLIFWLLFYQEKSNKKLFHQGKRNKSSAC